MGNSMGSCSYCKVPPWPSAISCCFGDAPFALDESAASGGEAAEAAAYSRSSSDIEALCCSCWHMLMFVFRSTSWRLPILTCTPRNHGSLSPPDWCSCTAG